MTRSSAVKPADLPGLLAWARAELAAAPRELLEKALKIAQEKGDLAAELKIVEALRERGDS